MGILTLKDVDPIFLIDKGNIDFIDNVKLKAVSNIKVYDNWVRYTGNSGVDRLVPTVSVSVITPNN